jgi:predicted nucleic acid-binding protein
MTQYLLDSDAVIDQLKGIQTTAALLQCLIAQGDVLCSCDIVISEVYAGLSAPARAASQVFLSTLRFLPTSEAAAQQSGIWRYDFARQGVTLSTTDTVIAAVAAEHGASIVTGNVRDYPMSGITQVVALPRVQGRGRP